MDWTGAIERNHKALRRILAMLIAMANAGAAGSPSPLWGRVRGGGSDTTITPTRQSDDCRPPHKGEVDPRHTLPRHLHRLVLRLLRPAEAATRRLVIVAARDVVLPPPALLRTASPVAQGRIGCDARTPKNLTRLAERGTAGAVGSSRPCGGGAPSTTPVRRLTLPLFDKLNPPRDRRLTLRSVPRITLVGYTQRFPIRRPPMPDDLVDATRIALRLQAIGRALDDLPGHARRFARWRARSIAAAARMKQSGNAGQFVRLWPLRPGRPPGARKRPTHEIHEVLADLQYFAFHALEGRTDSS